MLREFRSLRRRMVRSTTIWLDRTIRQKRFNTTACSSVLHLCQLASGIRCNQSAVTMRLGTGLTSAKLTLFFRSSTTGWTADSEYLLGAEFSLHGKKITPKPVCGMVNVDQFRQLLNPPVVLESAATHRLHERHWVSVRWQAASV